MKARYLATISLTGLLSVTTAAADQCGPWPGVAPEQNNQGINREETTLNRNNIAQVEPAWAFVTHPFVQNEFDQYGVTQYTTSYYSEAPVVHPAVCDGIAYLATMAGTGADQSRFGDPQDSLPWQHSDGDLSRLQGRFNVTDDAGQTVFEIKSTEAALYALDTETGDILWRTPTSEQPGRGDVWFHTTPRVVGDMVYISGAKVWAFDRHTGELLWSKSTDPANIHRNPNVENQDGDALIGRPANDYTGDLTVVDDLLIVPVSSVQDRLNMTESDNECIASASSGATAAGSIAAYDRFTGEEAWRFRVTNLKLPIPPKDDKQPMCECNGQRVRCGAGVGVWSTAAIDKKSGLLFIGTGQTHEPPASPWADSLLAIDYRTGRLAWSHQFTAGDYWHRFMNPVEDSKPAIKDRDVPLHPNLFEAKVDGKTLHLVGVGDKGGTYKIFNRTPKRKALKGKHLRQDALVHLQTVVDPVVTDSGAPLQATPAVYAGKLYITQIGNWAANNPNSLVAWNINELIAWAQAHPGAIAGYGDSLLNLVDEGVAAWAVGDKTGIPYNGFVPSPLTIANDLLYLGNGAGGILVYDPHTGEKIAHIAGPQTVGSVVVANGRLFITSIGSIFSGFGGSQADFWQVPNAGGMVVYELP